MPTFKVSAKAASDLYEIGCYTEQKFGKKQRNTYLDQIIEQFEQLAAQPDLGQNRQDIKSGYYSKLVGRHLIFYRKIEHRIRIIRVLHQAMDMPQHLTKS